MGSETYLVVEKEVGVLEADELTGLCEALVEGVQVDVDVPYSFERHDLEFEFESIDDLG